MEAMNITEQMLRSFETGETVSCVMGRTWGPVAPGSHVEVYSRMWDAKPPFPRSMIGVVVSHQPHDKGEQYFVKKV